MLLMKQELGESVIDTALQEGGKWPNIFIGGHEINTHSNAL